MVDSLSKRHLGEDSPRFARLEVAWSDIHAERVHRFPCRHLISVVLVESSQGTSAAVPTFKAKHESLELA